jgi:hypothetical protein
LSGKRDEGSEGIDQLVWSVGCYFAKENTGNISDKLLLTDLLKRGVEVLILDDNTNTDTKLPIRVIDILSG